MFEVYIMSFKGKLLTELQYSYPAHRNKKILFSVNNTFFAFLCTLADKYSIERQCTHADISQIQNIVTLILQYLFFDSEPSAVAVT